MNTKATKDRITFRIDSDLYEALRARARALRVSESWLIKDCLYRRLVAQEHTPNFKPVSA